MPHGWIDRDHDCQSTREEVLIRQSETPVTMDGRGCKVVRGRWTDPYSGEVYGAPGGLDADHLVPLAEAYRSGAQHWDAKTREAYANDLEDKDHLLAVSARLNRQKGSKGPDKWRPPLRSFWCQYAKDWTAIKKKWALTMTPTEAGAITEMLTTCPPTPPSR